MRGLIGFLVFAATLIAVLLFVAGPIVVRPLVVEVVRAALPFDGNSLDVVVEVDGFDLLGGRVGEIRVSGESLDSDAATVGSLDLTIRRVGLGGRDFETLDGSLESVTLALADGAPITVPSIALDGPSTSVRATARLERGDAEALIGRTLADAGLPADRVALVDGGVELDILGQRIMVPLAVAGGAVVMPAVMGLESVPVIAPGPDDDWRVTALAVEPTGLDIEATVDVESMVGAAAATRFASR